MNLRQNIYCEFSNPVNKDGEYPHILDTWNFKNINCTASGTTTNETLELIQNPDNGANFYISKKISYGDILVLTFLTIFLVYGLVKFFMDLMIPKRMNFKR